MDLEVRGRWCPPCPKTGAGWRAPGRCARRAAVNALVQMVAVGQQEQLAPLQHETVAALLDPSRLLQSFVLRHRRHMSQLQDLLLADTDF